MLLTAADVLLGLARALLPEQPGAALIPVLEGLPHAVLVAVVRHALERRSHYGQRLPILAGPAPAP